MYDIDGFLFATHYWIDKSQTFELVFILDRARYTICSENEVCFRSPYCGEVKSLNES